ncbi:hypothetical protein Q7C36_018379 [Tachysurus vachellii]|uniref:procollagen-proline 4-dioxygenase n=1 Tax=Tachysurus vachellii TaxID=175792 RepID=A0AA88M0Y9_TACVA|nr:hypothetical protein Q7C36_018379 [Tachysurus vachellii]
MQLKWILFLILDICAGISEFYSSTDHMTQLTDIKRDLTQSLQFCISSLENQMVLMKRALQDLDSISDDTSKDPEKLISNPLTAYKFIRQLRNVGTAIEKITKMDIVKALAIVRLQKFYRLEPKDMTGLETLSVLNPDECFHIAVIAHQNQQYCCAILWIQETVRKLHAGAEAVVTKQKVLNLLISIQFQLLNLPTALGVTQPLLDCEHLNWKPKLQSAFINNLKENIKNWDGMQHLITRFDMSSLQNPWQNGYEDLCRGQGIKMNPTRQKKLVCRYKTGQGNPQMMYAPAKEEEEWDEPLILRYHDLISLSEIDVLKRLSRTKLSRAKVSDPVTGKLISTTLRVSKSAWLSKDENPVVARVNQRIADITGLDVDTAEDLQVANYGIGGHYEPHYDSMVANGVPFTERRIATVLVYMSDVEVGGSTVFPDIGAALQPKIGSAVIWLNLLKNGEEDTRTLHAACPVFVGSKWVANKWIRCRGQEFRRRCTLSRSE